MPGTARALEILMKKCGIKSGLEIRKFSSETGNNRLRE